MNRLTPHVWWLPPDPTTDRPLLGVIAGERATLIVDAGNSPRHAHLLLDELARLSILPPTYLALTHWHWDHVFGASAFPIPTFASAETARVVTAMASWDWSDAALASRVASGLEIPFCRDMMRAEMPDRSGLIIRPPDIVYSSPIEVNLGGLTCHIAPVGGDHDAGSSIVYVPEEGVLFLGDCLGSDIYQNPSRYTISRLFPLLDRLIAFDAHHYLAAHDLEPMTRQQMGETAGFLKDIGSTVARLHGDRRATVAALEELFGAALSADQSEIMDEFLAGLDK